MIWATPLPPSCGSFQTFAEALRIFLRAGAPPIVGSTPGLGSEGKVGPRREEMWCMRERSVLQGTPSLPAVCTLLTPPSPRPQAQGPREDSDCHLLRAEMPAQRPGSLPTGPCRHHHMAEWDQE